MEDAENPKSRQNTINISQLWLEFSKVMATMTVVQKVVNLEKKSDGPLQQLLL